MNRDYNNTRPVIYLSGPMRGRDHYNFPLFYAAQGLLELWGWNVLNPARMDMESGKAAVGKADGNIMTVSTFTMQDALARDYRAILSASAIGVLPGWEYSEGACREVAIGLDIGLPVYAVNLGTGKTDTLLDPATARSFIHARLAPDWKSPNV